MAIAPVEVQERRHGETRGAIASSSNSQNRGRHWYSRPIGSGVLRNSSECDGREAQKHHAAQNTVPQPAKKIVTDSVTAISV
jgi:hypothetical protein